MLISNNNFSFVFLLLLNIIVISKSSTDYVFLKPSKEEMLNIKSMQPVEYEGIIEAIENSFEIYFFSTSYIEEDKDGNYINYIDKFTIIPGYTHNISNGKRFMIIMGTGFISFGATEKTEIKLAKLKTITLPFYLNNKYFKLVGNGNTFEIGVDNPNVCVYINNYCYYKNYTLTGLSNGQIVIIRNFNNAKNEKINLLFSYRKDDYLIDEEKGDSISYYFPQTEALQKRAVSSTSPYCCTLLYNKVSAWPTHRVLPTNRSSTAQKTQRAKRRPSRKAARYRNPTPSIRCSMSPQSTHPDPRGTDMQKGHPHPPSALSLRQSCNDPLSYSPHTQKISQCPPASDHRSPPSPLRDI